MADIFINDPEARQRSTRPAPHSLDARIPDPLALLRDLVKATGLTRLLTRIERRRRFRALLNYDDHTLDDIGLTRLDVERAARLPLEVNAAIEAHSTAKARRNATRGIRRR